jgi:hypothetical protein
MMDVCVLVLMLLFLLISHKTLVIKLVQNKTHHNYLIDFIWCKSSFPYWPMCTYFFVWTISKNDWRRYFSFYICDLIVNWLLNWFKFNCFLKLLNQNLNGRVELISLKIEVFNWFFNQKWCCWLFTKNSIKISVVWLKNAFNSIDRLVGCLKW